MRVFLLRRQVDEVMLTLKQAFSTAAALQSTKTPVQLCEACPMHDLHKLCERIEGASLLKDRVALYRSTGTVRELTGPFIFAQDFIHPGPSWPSKHTSLSWRIMSKRTSLSVSRSELIHQSDDRTWTAQVSNMWQSVCVSAVQKMKPSNDQEENELVILQLRQLCETKQKTHLHIGQVPQVWLVFSTISCDPYDSFYAVTFECHIGRWHTGIVVLYKLWKTIFVFWSVLLVMLSPSAEQPGKTEKK